MKRIVFTLSLLVVLFGFALTADARIAPLRAVFISGSAEYESDKTMPILKKYLESKYPSVVTILRAKSQTDLPGLEALDTCNVAVLFTRRLELKGDQLDRIKKYCTSGKPLVGIRTASHAIQTWLDLDREVLGGNYKGHYAVGPVCEVQRSADDFDHVIFHGVKPFKSKGSLYKNTGLSKDVQVLFFGRIPGHEEPVAWTRMYKGGRIFYTSLGAQSDFQEENFLQLMTNGILWSAGREPRKK